MRYVRKCGGNQKENFLFSQLTTVLYNICFGDDIEKIKFRIIGTIYPNTGYYQSAKDTIVFLYDFVILLTDMLGLPISLEYIMFA